MFILIDNYDSFTYNLYHYLGELGAELEVYRNDQITVDEVIAKAPQGIILSPGPCDPDRAGICLDLIKAAAAKKIPLLGVCLGHQAIGQAFGGKVVRAPKPMHGKLSHVHHRNKSVFLDLPDNFDATRYHSLIVERETFPQVLEVTAETDDGIIMGLCHRNLPIAGVQFHPESIASQHGHKLLANFLTSAGLNKINTRVLQ
ncbi:anthranilate synthase component II [Dongia mobilis]|uniref:Anthranilate synthase component II n=1 Tax=Dongia mobilis TaxID=578943 RepID=A0A4R6WH07_9PROT|nr:aminodeoxychorismate/anthranilate synthase component II [Dongia mobilis]TDQ77720.1 anthranilate synthase component II [Dongia mobilis]